MPQPSTCPEKGLGPLGFRGYGLGFGGFRVLGV